MLRTIGPVAIVLLVITLCTSPSDAQRDNPVYVDDSPQAWELFRQARDQAKDNPGEAVRLYQELLDEFPMKLIPVSEAASDHFRAVRLCVIDALRADPSLLERYRQIQSPQAQQMLDASKIEAVAMSYVLTEPGLEALLRLAQRDLESAKFHAARYWLDEALRHPDLAGRRAVHAWYMQGVAAYYLRQTQTLEASIGALSQLGHEGEAFLRQLNVLAATDDYPDIAHGISTLDVVNAVDLEDLVPQAIWSVPLEESLLHRRFAGRASDHTTEAVMRQRLLEADLTTTVPTVAGSVVLVNQGQSILAINRITGHTVWSHDELGYSGRIDRDGNDPLDLNVVATDGDAVVTITGHASGNGRSDGRVLCLDAATGSLRWSVQFGNLLETAAGENFFPHGAPIVADGMVFVAGRKLSQSLTSTFIVALDLHSGDLRWMQYITSSGGLRVASRPFDTLIYDAGSLYIASAVGATARLEATTGEVRWLRRFGVPINVLLADQTRRPWEMACPAVTPRGLVVVQPDQRRVALLDLETGDVLESHQASSSIDWNTPRYLLAANDMVFGIGSEVRAFHIDNLAEPLWRLPAPEQRLRDGDFAPRSSRIEMRGRVQLADDALIVPTNQGVLIVDQKSGDIRQKLELDSIGNPLATDAQLLVSSGDRLDAYMSFNRAEAMLRDRMAAAPTDPEPALSLLRLGMRVRDLSLALESADLALQAIHRRSAANPSDTKTARFRDDLFDLLLELAASKIAVTVQDGEALYAMIGTVAADARQRVAHLLAYGDWLTNHSLEKAVESYQAILSDPALALSWQQEGELNRPAADWAIRRLAQLIRTRGEHVYAPQADYARFCLRQLLNDSNVSPDQLIALAEEFPFAEASIEAVLQGASRMAAQGRHREALTALLSVYQRAPNANNAARLLGQFIAHCEDLGWTTQARDALEHIVNVYGDVRVISRTGEKSASQWLAELNTVSPSPTLARPVLGLPGTEAQTLSGSVVAAHEFAVSSLPTDRFLLREGADLRLIDAKTLEPLWHITLKDDLPEILRFDRRNILLWYSTDAMNPHAVMLNAEDGTVRWSTPRLSQLLSNPVADLVHAQRVREQMPTGEPFDPLQTLPVVTDQSLILIQRSGGVIAFDLTDGQTVQWSRPKTLEQVHLVAHHEAALVLAGMAHDAGGSAGSTKRPWLMPAILVLDPRTGEPVFGQNGMFKPASLTGVKWLQVGPLGQLIYATSESIDAIDLYAGRRMWSNSNHSSIDSLRSWWVGEHVVIEDHRGRLRNVNVRDGLISEPFQTPVRGEWDVLELRHVIASGNRLIARYRQRILIYEPDSGLITGADAISDERDYLWLLPAQDRMVLINYRAEQVLLADQPIRRTRYHYRIHLLSDNGKAMANPVELPPLSERVLHAGVVDEWLLLSTRADTIAIPVPRSQQSSK